MTPAPLPNRRRASPTPSAMTGATKGPRLPPPRKATVSDYDELIAFLNRIFRIRMDRQYSHIYKRTQKDTSNNIVVVDNGRVVSCVGIFPMTLVCGGVRLTVGGIGGVSTQPRYRGRGLMTKLLKKSIAMMQRHNYDISVLWGDRKRYGRFGWENAGRQYTFAIGRRYVPPEGAADAEIRRFSNSVEDIREIGRLHQQGELRVLRTRKQLQSVLNRQTYETWTWRKGGAFAYVTVKGETKDRELIEFGGDVSGLDHLLRFLFEKFGLENLRGTVAVSRSPYVPFILDRSSQWGVRFIGMVKILNLKAVLEKFAPQLEKRCREMGLTGSLSLEMTDSGQTASLHFGKRITVGDRKQRLHLRLSDTEMVRLIFGTLPPSHGLQLGESFRYLDALLPLDFYIGRLDYV